MKSLLQALVACALAEHALAASAADWRSRSIYQLLTDRFALSDGSTTAACNTGARKYCGGTWQGIIKQLDYIKGMGFTAIWISPVTYQLPNVTDPWGEAYHGFWQQDLYRLNPHFGTADDLKALSQALHDKDMYLMVDLVTNHNGWNGAPSTVDYTKFNPFNNKKYYHPYCAIVDNYNQTQIENCWLGDNTVQLVDLNTQLQSVRDGYNTWIKQLVSNYSIDGIRIDTAKYVEKPFWSSFQQAAGVFGVGEVVANDAPYTCNYTNYMDSVLNYPVYTPLMKFLNSTSGSSTALLSMMSNMNTACKDFSVLGTFSENHDVLRFAGQTPDLSLAKNALAFTILSDGIPMVYAGQEQHYASVGGVGDPYNREATWLSGYSRTNPLYNLIAALNQVRNVALTQDPDYAIYKAWPIYSDTHTVALRKGFDGNQIISVITNTGVNNPAWTLNLTNTGFAAGTSLVEVITCNQIAVSSSGVLAVPMLNGEPRVYYTVAAAAGTGICDIAAGSYKARGVDAGLVKMRGRGGMRERRRIVDGREVEAGVEGM